MRVLFFVLVFLFAMTMAQSDGSLDTLASAPKPIPAPPAQNAAVNPVTPGTDSISKPVASTPKGKIVIFQSVTKKQQRKKTTTKKNGKTKSVKKTGIAKKFGKSVKSLIRKMKKAVSKTSNNKGQTTIRKLVKKQVKVPPKHIKKHIHKTAKTIRKLPVVKRAKFTRKLTKAVPKKYHPYVKKVVRKSTTKKVGKKSTKKAGKKSTKATKKTTKKSTKKPAAPSLDSGNAELKNVFNSVFNPSAVKLPKPSKTKKFKLVLKNLVNNGSLRLGKGKCGGKLRVSFNGETSLKIRKLRL